MWELIAFTNGIGITISRYADFNQCQQMSYIHTYINEGMVRFICAVTL